jgi:hypothetical protein
MLGTTSSRTTLNTGKDTRMARYQTMSHRNASLPVNLVAPVSTWQNQPHQYNRAGEAIHP